MTQNQAPNQDQSSPAVERLAEMVELATLRAQLAEQRASVVESEKRTIEAERSRLLAQFPTGSIQPQDGTVTIDASAGSAAQLVAYDAVARAADRIAAQIKALPLQADDPPAVQEVNILIVDTLDFAGVDVLVLQMKEQFKFWGDELDNYSKTIINEINPGMEGAEGDIVAALALIPIASNLLSAAAGVVGFFKSNYDIQGYAVDKDDIPLRLRVAKTLKDEKLHIRVFLPRLLQMTSSSIIKMFNECLGKRRKLLVWLNELKNVGIDNAAEEIAAITQRIEALNTQIAALDAAANKDQIAVLNERLSELNAPLKQARQQMRKSEAILKVVEELVKAFDEFVTEITTVAAGAASSPLELAAIRDYLTDMRITHFLYIKMTSLGAESRIKKSLFSSSTPVTYLGGTVVTYALVDSTGQIIASDIIGEMAKVKDYLDKDTPPTFGAIGDKAHVR